MSDQTPTDAVEPVAVVPALPEIIIDFDSLDLADLEEIEKVTGARAGSMFAGGMANLSAATLAGVVYALQRKVDPAFTYEDARHVKFTQITEGPTAPLVATP